MLKTAVIGYGYWGPNLVRNLFQAKDCEVVAVSDANPRRLECAQRLYPQIRTTVDAAELIADPSIDALAIATPVATHYALLTAALRAGKHVLVTKPMTQTSAEAEEVIALAERQKRVILVDHTFIYSGPVRKIRELIDKNELGDVYYYDAIRVNLGLFQPDVNVLWNLAPHDLSILTYLIGKRPVCVSAIGASPINYSGKEFESVAYIIIQFEDKTIAHVHVSWLSPVKIRRTLIGGSRKMIVYDHLDPDSQIKVYDKRVEVSTLKEQYETQVQYRSGDMNAPKVDQTEALELECRHFVDCCGGKAQPITDGYAGLHVVRLLEAAQLSIQNGGTMVPLSWNESSLSREIRLQHEVGGLWPALAQG